MGRLSRNRPFSDTKKGVPPNQKPVSKTTKHGSQPDQFGLRDEPFTDIMGPVSPGDVHDVWFSKESPYPGKTRRRSYGDSTDKQEG